MGEGAFHAKDFALVKRGRGDQGIERHEGAWPLGAGAEKQSETGQHREFVHPAMVGRGGPGCKLASQ